MGRILGIDFGLKRIGLALSDPLKIIASPIKTVQFSTSLEFTVEIILKELAQVEKIVLGLPLLLSGQDSETTKLVRKFAAILMEKTKLPIVLWDERLTSSQVNKFLKSQGKMNRKNRSQHVDKMCATLILQNYLDGLANGNS